MGLDALDLKYRLEKRFGVKIDHAEAYAALFGTAGDLHRYLVAKVRGEYDEAPRMEPLVMVVAQAVHRVAGRWRLSMSSDLNKRFSPKNREDRWKALQEALDLPLPELEHAAGEKYPRIPRSCESVVSLSYWIVEHHPDRVEWLPVSHDRVDPTALRQWTEDEAWDAMRECICDALGVRPEKVTSDARMVEDLGME